MTTPRIFLESPTSATDTKITDDNHHYLKNVLRMRVGEKLFIATPNEEFLATIVKVAAQETAVKILETIDRTPTLPAAGCLTLAQALLKADKMELIAQKASELGVVSFAPFISQRSIARPTPDKLAAKRSRWEHISMEAARKSLRQAPMRVQAIDSFEQMLARAYSADRTVKIIFWEEETTLLLGDFIASPSFLPARDGGVFFIVGPEGGFNAEEVGMAKAAGFISVSLGKALLKAETAAIATVAILSYATGGYSRFTKLKEGE